MNARYTLNAANARWVSLYDSLYGTNIIELEEGGSERYDPQRGQEVIKYVREFFDKLVHELQRLLMFYKNQSH